jgi:DNA gyrase subunit A
MGVEYRAVQWNRQKRLYDLVLLGAVAGYLVTFGILTKVMFPYITDEIMLITNGGQMVRTFVKDIREAGRNTQGVKLINLAEGDKLISLSILRHVDASADERAAYLKRASAVRRGLNGGEADETPPPDAEEAQEGAVNDAIELGEQRYVEMSAAEQFVLTVSEHGYGKRSSSYEYRTTGRGGKGIVAMSVNNRNGKLVASFPVEHSDQIMLVTDKGQLIRCPVEDIRIAGRSTQGVIVFDTAEDEHVVSVEHIGDDGENGENGNGG